MLSGRVAKLEAESMLVRAERGCARALLLAHDADRNDGPAGGTADMDLVLDLAAALVVTRAKRTPSVRLDPSAWPGPDRQECREAADTARRWVACLRTRVATTDDPVAALVAVVARIHADLVGGWAPTRIDQATGSLTGHYLSEVTTASR